MSLDTDFSHWDEINDDDLVKQCDAILDKNVDLQYSCCARKRKSSNETDNSCSEPKIANINALESNPLQEFRRGYLWVSDLLSQAWCEQKMVYGFTLPTVVVEDPVMKAGSDMHLARELEVHDVVQVKVTSNEDIFAVKVLNICKSTHDILHGINVCREIPIFGAPFGDVFLMGMIDEIRCDQESYTLDLVEFKTRQFKSLPSQAQALTHRLQVMIYKTLFDNLVTGKTTKALLAKHLQLDLHKKLGKDVYEHMRQAGLNECIVLDKLLDVLYERMTMLPQISRMLVEYSHQEDKSTIGIREISHEPDMLVDKMDYFIKYWKGERQACGVEIEEAWKCGRCDFSEVCEWRARKSEEYANRNSVKLKT